LLVHLVDHLLELSPVHVTAEFGPDASRVDGCRTNAVPAMPPHSCISYDQVESVPARQEFIGAGADALQTGQIDRDQLEAATIRRGVFSHLCGRGFSLHKVPCRSYYLRAVCRKSPRRLNADARGHASDENAFSVQIDSR
jgi:hypothetical protein